MNSVTALRTGGRMLWERSASVVPVYLLASGLYGAARTPFLLAGLLAVWFLAATGRLEPLIDVLRELGGESAPVGPGGPSPTDPGAADVERFAPELADALANLLTPETVLLLVGGGIASAALALLASAVGSAAAISALFGLLRGDDGVRAAVDGARRRWLSFLGVRLLLLAALAAVVVPLVGLVAAIVGVSASIGAAASATGGSPVGVASAFAALAAVLVVLVGTLLVLVVLLFFAFADQAVVVDEVGAVAAVGRSVRFPFRRPWAALGYVGVAVGALAVTGTVASVASFVGAPRVTALVGAVVLPPVVDGFKTALYAERSLPAAVVPDAGGDGGPDAGADGNSEAAVDADTGAVAADSGPWREPASAGERARAAFVGGLRAVGAFVRDRPATNLASLGVFVVGAVVGWTATASLGVTFPVGDVGGVFGSFPVGTFVNLAVNNWLVAADVAYSGLAAGVPAAVTLAFNGLLVGAVGGVFDPLAFVALVAPHGIVEIPALVVGGGLGLWLGGVVVGAARGRRDAADVASSIRRAYRVLLGLVPLFVVAAFVEAFLTPAVASVVLGG